jgi:hypothetical protein
MNPDGGFFSQARCDPAVLHCLFYLVALSFNLRNGVSDSPESLYHGSQAFKIINDRIETGNFTDMTLGAVAMLVTKENLNGNYDIAKMHMSGLNYMVKSRGGIHMLQGVFRRIVTWSDFCFANVWNCQPQFPRLSLPSDTRDFSLSDFELNLLAPEDLFGPESPMVSIFHDLRALASDFEPENIGTIDRLAASNTIYNVEYTLLALNKVGMSDPDPHECIYSYETVPLKTAAHLFLYLVIREIPPTSQLLLRLVERLREALEIQMGGWWETTFDRRLWLLWMLFIGGAVAKASWEKSWFVRELGVACKGLGFESEQSLKEGLKRVLWQEAWFGTHCENLWGDILLLEMSDGGKLYSLDTGVDWLD